MQDGLTTNQRKTRKCSCPITGIICAGESHFISIMDSPASGLFAACPIEEPTVHNISPIVDLPTNIWALIADKLGSAEDFAKACGTCRSFHAVQPSSLNLACRSKERPVRNIERILWGLRHGREASAVWIYDLHIRGHQVPPMSMVCLALSKPLIWNVVKGHHNTGGQRHVPHLTPQNFENDNLRV